MVIIYSAAEMTYAFRMSNEKTLHKILSRDAEKTLDVSKLQLEALMLEVRRNAQLEMLNWFMKICSSVLNLAHARRAASMRFEEIEKEMKDTPNRV